jgi:LmbE family N-acetylglucosaminyl deacetylase
LLGVTDVFFAGFKDGHLADTRKVRRAIVRYIRQTKPDAVIGWDPSYWYCPTYGLGHPDHQAAGAATNAAIYPLARDHLSFPKLLAVGYEPHRVQTMLMINPATSNWTHDVSAYLDTKVDAIRAHASQAVLETLSLRTTESFVRIDLPF